MILEYNAGIDFIQFRPSEIAAAVAVTLSVKGENQTVQTEKAVSLLIEYVEKVRKQICCNYFITCNCFCMSDHN
jgi:cyclin D1/2/4